MAEWQPIETAPRDDSKVVILYDPTILGDEVQVGFWFDGISEDDPEGWYWVDASDVGPIAPTHWMPLPEPPGDDNG